jgi:hypothetical protein
VNRPYFQCVHMSMGEWIRADLSRIGQVAGQISALGAEFERATSLVDGYEDALGSAQVAAALDAFAGNWAIHRGRLVADLAQEADLARSAVAAYHGTDDQLAAALAKGGG